MLTHKQETFTQNLFKGMTQREAWIQAGYSSKYALDIVDRHASVLAHKDEIKMRLAELNEKLIDKDIMDKKEILKKHSIIGRAAVTDFQTAGADGSYIDVGKENEHTGAIQELTSRTEYDKDGSSPAVITKVKLHDPVRSMQEIAKLMGYYPKEGIGEGITINIEQAVIDAGNRLDGALKRLAERVSPELETEKEE